MQVTAGRKPYCKDAEPEPSCTVASSLIINPALRTRIWHAQKDIASHSRGSAFDVPSIRALRPLLVG
jgi:hypothetical protein